MSWLRENALSWAQSFCVGVCKTGRVPSHIAFVMDGNRRYADRNNMGRGEGHARGFDKLAETLQWCLDLGVPQVTVYAFSIENFKRSPEEVDVLMKLAEDKFKRLLEEKDRLAERGVRVNVVGRLDLLSPELRSLVAKAILLTKDHDRAILNVAFAYTGRDEMARTIGKIISGVRDGLLASDDVDERLFDLTLDLSPPDLLIRTSGEVRLSDFMIWQISDTCLYFTDVLWPDFRLWHLLAAIIHYQRVAPHKLKIPTAAEQYKSFLNRIDEAKWKKLNSYICPS